MTHRDQSDYITNLFNTMDKAKEGIEAVSFCLSAALDHFPKHQIDFIRKHHEPKFKHECCEWDSMEIDEFDCEFYKCRCFEEDEEDEDEEGGGPFDDDSWVHDPNMEAQ